MIFIAIYISKCLIITVLSMLFTSRSSGLILPSRFSAYKIINCLKIISLKCQLWHPTSQRLVNLYFKVTSCSILNTEAKSHCAIFKQQRIVAMHPVLSSRSVHGEAVHAGWAGASRRAELAPILENRNDVNSRSGARESSSSLSATTTPVVILFLPCGYRISSSSRTELCVFCCLWFILFSSAADLDKKWFCFWSQISAKPVSVKGTG